MKKQWFEIRNDGTDTEPAEVLIYDQIGRDWWTNDGVTAKDFADALKTIPKDRALTVGINSPGGNVWDGLAIYNQLKSRGDKVTTRVDGIAASIASVILMAGARIEMPANALVMIHKTWGFAQGNADVLDKLSQELQKHDGVVADIYAERTGQAKDKLLEMMAEETWMDGTEAVEMGFADAATDEVAMAACAKGFDFKRFRYVPEAVLGTAPALRDHTKQNKVMNDTPNAAGAPNATAEPPKKADPTADLLVAQAAKQKELETQIADLKAKAEKEREMRLRARLCQVVGANEVDGWIASVMADEKLIDKLEAALPKPDRGPVPTPIDNLGHPFLDYKKLPDHKARVKEMRLNYGSRILGASNEDRRRGMVPFAANTYSSTLMTDLLADGVITDLQHFSAPLRAFSRTFTPDPMKPNATVQVKNVTAGPTVVTVDTSTSTYESGNSTWAALSVTVAQLVSAIQIDNFDLQSGGRLADLAEIGASKLSAAINAVWTTLLTNAAYSTNAGVTSAAEAFGISELKTLWGQLEKARRKYCTLDGPYYAQILPTNREAFGPGDSSAYGYEGLFQCTDWSNASNNIVGFACNPQAMCVVSGVPMEIPGAGSTQISRQNFMLPDLEMTIALHTWFNNTTRTLWASYDCMFGAAVGDETAGAVIRSA